MSRLWELKVAPRTPEIAYEVAQRIAKAAGRGNSPLFFSLVVGSQAAAEQIKSAIEGGPPYIVRRGQVQVVERDPDRRSRETAAMQWLRDYFDDEDQHLAAPVAEVMAEGQKAGFSPHQLQRAKKRLGVQSIRAAEGRGWCWTASRRSRDQVLWALGLRL